VLLNEGRPDTEVLARYQAEGAELVVPDASNIANRGYIPIMRSLVSQDNWVRHDPDKLSRALIGVAEHELALAI